jgi:peptide/nickel transport system permease protein
VAFVIGAIFGLVVLGWYLLPAGSTGVSLQQLAPARQEFFIRIVAERYSRDGDPAKVRQALEGWGGEVVACEMADQTDDPAETNRLRAIAEVITSQSCAGVSATAQADVEAGADWLPVLALFIAEIVLLWGIVATYRRRQALTAAGLMDGHDVSTPEVRPVIGGKDLVTAGASQLPSGHALADSRALVAPARLSWLARRRQRMVATARRFREAWDIFAQNRIAVIGCILLVVFAMLPVLHARLRATVWNSGEYDPIFGFEQDSMPNPAPPSWIPVDWLEPDDVHRFDLNRPSFEHLLGTDTLGRDVLSVLMASTTTTFIVGLTAAVTTAVIGIAIGALSAYYRGLVDGFFSHVSDAFLLLPPPIFMIAAGVFLQTQRTTILEMVYQGLTGNGVSDAAKHFLQPFEFGLIFGIIAGAGGAAIVLRSHALKVMNMSFIEASRVSGASGRHIILRHLVPQMLPLAAIYMMVIVTGAVVADGFLAFFGLNPNPLNWGTMIYNAFTYFILNFVTPWSALMAPAVTISLFTASFYMVSRGLHQVIEPRLREDYAG